MTHRSIDMDDWPIPSPPEAKPLVTDAPLESNQHEKRWSGSVPSRRSSYYADQRHERRSRPNSGASQRDPFLGRDANAPPVPLLRHIPSAEDPYALGPVKGGPDADDFSNRAVDDVVPTALPMFDHSISRQSGVADLEAKPSDTSLSEPAYTARKPEEYLPKQDHQGPPPQSRWWTELCTVSYLIFFAIWGTLARLGMQWITFYPGAPIVTPVLWANMAGSFVLGFLAEDKHLFSRYWIAPSTREKTTTKRWSNQSTDFDKLTKAETGKIKKTIPLYVGIATGFCGSFTSFSSFARDMFGALANNLPTPVNHVYHSTIRVTNASSASRNAGYSFNALLAVIISTLALSLGGLIVGAHTAQLLEPWTPRVATRVIRRFIDPAIVAIAWLCWFGAILLAILPPDRPSGPSSRGDWSNETWRGTVLFAIVFAPLGCLLRHYASVRLNPLVPSFPLGTFAVNMFGTAIEGMLYDFQQVGIGSSGLVSGGLVGCQVLQGMQDGFCGCLTTVSTWVAEINGMRKRHGYVYALSSVIGALCLVIIIMGSVRWTVGWQPAVCDRGYPDKYVT
nr:hypothetical protein B0A51_08155 [Rachicladosporium sp. CCFEE 5018]